jgi:Na+(H+)/acetate symporter ActP
MSFFIDRSDYMGFSFIMFALIFIVVYFVCYFIFDDMLKKEKYTKLTSLVLLTNRFNLDKKQMDYKSTMNGVAIINAFIIAFTFIVIDLIPVTIALKLVIGFVIMMILMFGLYISYGKKLQKKWGKK